MKDGSIVSKNNIHINSVSLEIVVFANNNFKLLREGRELDIFIDKNNLSVYCLREGNGKTTHFFKHDIAKKHLLEGSGDYIIYKDGDVKNLKLDNLKVCNFREYRESMIKLSDINMAREKSLRDKRAKRKTRNINTSKHRILLPDGSRRRLRRDIPIEDKVAMVKELLYEWDEDISSSWDSTYIKYFLSDLSNYLVWHKDVAYERDSEVLSIDDMKKMDGKRESKTEPLRKGDSYDL